MTTHKHYQRPAILFHPHVETIYPALLRRVALKPYQRERITTPDDDFLDLDWLKQGAKKLVMISHGLEGNTERAYIKGMAKIFYEHQFDVLTWNYRGCSEEMNKQRRFYHSGATDDVDLVVQHALTQGYEEMTLIGFSLGGNLTLKYLGESKRDERIKKSIVFSVPMDLHSSCIQLARPSNRIYVNRFLQTLKQKVKDKAALRNDLDISGIDQVKDLQGFDDQYTSVLHGFRDAVDYYTQCSSLRFAEFIQIPTLIVNAKNDPFLSEACFPAKQFNKHPFVQLEIPAQGGHVGFAQFNKKGVFWSEERALLFVQHD
ncbi:MAG: alpha/beta fold hydrolase [Cytophagia bacterium]|nr:alpha/beta fold hydrolase [Cytophagia bacterium]NBW38979.1 alpha/beta fold hydrolase [Cytophagia bacterium]